jgi:transcriptional regulator with XRE-family HTH domain
MPTFDRHRYRLARERAGLSRESAARAIGCLPGTIRKVEMGDRSPSLDLLCRSLAVYRVDVAQVFTDEQLVAS